MLILHGGGNLKQRPMVTVVVTHVMQLLGSHVHIGSKDQQLTVDFTDLSMNNNESLLTPLHSITAWEVNMTPPTMQ